MVEPGEQPADAVLREVAEESSPLWGTALPLTDRVARNDLRHFTFDEAAAVLRAVRSFT